ncbi:MAG: heavy-metal-associated domain-containing protein [Saprospiraceae bacterium]|jgi:copper chaperone|nr:heavy-metal-associated domain-containing protein [Saprospiraceae bacterium]MBK7795798.1 heavy-metal-associated domain-containing protein [Saprospiraceae bacterium]MBK8154352.1 heavy-metal-associated domain-containing protein [Saprospiraceae bacterium]MBK9379400.1 heavy-metal-associated domain-containing protein [Saprospiraceae bacterium]MBL0260912.1 heavy-metal-associated domain-containing protein [Saprospiraceae bacterium]
MDFVVENIKCHGCVNSIKTGLFKIEGVEQVSIDLDSQTIRVDGNADPELIKKSLSGMGYPLLGDNNIIHKAKSYVSCAIGRLDTEAV